MMLLINVVGSVAILFALLVLGRAVLVFIDKVRGK
jgi:hypothetical protein